MPPISRDASPEQAASVKLPPIIAGPFLRRAKQQSQPLTSGVLPANHAGVVQLGSRAFLHCISLTSEIDLPVDEWLEYDLGIEDHGNIQWLAQLVAGLCYAEQPRPRFVLKAELAQVLHGSCRKPHHDGLDGLLQADDIAASAIQQHDTQRQPALMMFTGDQVYTDDIAGPYLSAIVQVVGLLGLYSEELPAVDGHTSICSRSLAEDPGYFHRSDLLPSKKSAGVQRILFSGARKPIFTSINAENHLLTLGEVIAQYLLAWSPELWQLVDIDTVPATVNKENVAFYRRQIELIKQFRDGLPRVRRVLAHIPTYMIFDDHDITDDWNLSRAWEESAYGQPMAKRIIGNALIGYWLFQGWGNAPARFAPEMMQQLREMFKRNNNPAQDQLINGLLKFEQWSYVIDTQPRVVVLDTRTQRWQSDTMASWPSGLMDWESLADAQQHLLGQQAVVLVSSAPIFGVKLIEVVQRVSTWLGLSLMVDAENWMAHSGCAGAILNIFRHRKTPQNFVILSGDVHYAFVYDVLLRRVNNSPHIWQITSSGLRNSFPASLLRKFDRLNRWLFASRSPLNWLTQRRRMRIRQRRPSQYSARYRHQRLVNGAGIGRVTFDGEGRPVRIEHVLATGESVEFLPGYESDWVH